MNFVRAAAAVVIVLTGVSFVLYGVWQMFPPIAYVLGGMFLIVFGAVAIPVDGRRRSRRTTRDPATLQRDGSNIRRIGAAR